MNGETYLCPICCEYGYPGIAFSAAEAALRAEVERG